ncbi:bifunctional UDP-sugar hydrolase/5'-nucleotidase [Nocardioides sp. YIM 152315]|uniref:bifunctional metallophosphatase/5'-nucleotidase n=1 Tax=Nocardioides sp. YIM 152315 TaxID=3031760 RepID=UPI0023D9E393|nr:bifunctional UDP-sugar hydrolase/5'-nucleotidase [Nocardioides sp. YIM 152315]MDF1605513.1 bifunctional UDP-sugar hydrolase/5'-nucleotidase [Nocardioides sp. YIM 152315]
MAVSSLALVSAGLTLVAAAPAQAATTVDVTILATNDFHGRIKANGAEAGAAAIATYVKNEKATNPHTVFAAAGDLIGASTFESFIAHDKPTIDALNEARLDVSAVGNHEFDKGYADLVNRVMAPYNATTNPEGGAGWKYVGANLVEPNGADAIKASWIAPFADVKVGFIGAVTEHLPELVSPAGIQGLQVTDVVNAVNAEATAMKAAGADAIVLLVHEGAPSTDCATMASNPASDFGSIVTGVSADVNAIVSGHTHLAYSCDLAGPGGVSRPVVSAGQYGYNLNRLDLTIDTDANAVTAVNAADTRIVPLTTKSGDTYTPIPQTQPADPATKAIVDAAVANAEVKGAAPLGKISGALYRASRPVASGTGTEENRGGESTLGNLVAEAQRWATRSATTGSAKIAFMNPGGLRADMLGNNAGGYPAVLTYKQAANVQPFANTLVNMKLTGAQLRAVLEQQWQPAGASRPFLRLGVSQGFTYTYDPATKKVTNMWLKGKPVADATAYSVTVNSFLASGGDNFAAFKDGTERRDTGQTDLEGMVAFMDAKGGGKGLPVSYKQRAVGITMPTGAPRAYRAGDTLSFKVSSLAYTGVGDAHDKRIDVTLGKKKLGKAKVVNTVAPGATDDEAGTATVSVKVPGGVKAGVQRVKLTGGKTRTAVLVPVRFKGNRLASTLKAKLHPKKVVVRKGRAKVRVHVRAGGEPAVGKVRIRAGHRPYLAKLNKKGVATFRLLPFKQVEKLKVKVAFLRTDALKGDRKVLTLRVVRRR